MENSKIESLDSLIAKEKRNIAQEYFTEAWEGAEADGIEPETIADALVEGAISALAQSRGESFARELIARIRQKDDFGDFLPRKSLQ